MPSADSQLEDLAQLEQMARESAEGFNDGDLDRIMRFYGDADADINFRNPVQSHAERRAHDAQVIKRGFHLRVRPDDIEIHGDFAFVRGTVELIPREAAGDFRPTELRYLEIVRRQTDGSWKVMEGCTDRFRSTRPPRETESAGWSP